MFDILLIYTIQGVSKKKISIAFGLITLGKNKTSKKTRKLDAGLKDEARRGKRNTRSRGAKKTKDKTLQNFYRFQLREGKESELQELRRKFEADKQKVADMKMKKRLNPLA